MLHRTTDHLAGNRPGVSRREYYTPHRAGQAVGQVSRALFHRLTRTAYLYNGCLALYNVVLTSRVYSSVKYSQTLTVTAAVSCDGGISVLNHCLTWSKFVNTHFYHSSQWFNIHVIILYLGD